MFEQTHTLAVCRIWRAILITTLALMLQAGCARSHMDQGAVASTAGNAVMKEEMRGRAGYDMPYDTVPAEAAPAPAMAPSGGDLSSGPTSSLGQTEAATTSMPDGKPVAGGSLASIKIDDWFLPQAYAADNAPDERYLIRDATLSLDIDNYDESAKQVASVADKHGGLVTDSSMEKYGDGTRTGWVKVRLPAENFFAAWEEFKALGEVKNQQVTSQDVSNQYISTVSRLKVLQTEQETLQTMLKEALAVQRSRGLGEAYSVLLQTQQRLSEVSYEIQNNEDQLSQLADQITRSTITVNLTERAAYQAEEWNWGYGETLAGAKKDLMLKWRGFLQGVIYFFVSGWTGLLPWAILFIIGWFVYKRVIRPRLKRRAKT
jgi:hypothetical protein